MVEPELVRRIRDELKRTVCLLLEQVRREHPADCFYAILFEVDVRQTYVVRVAGSEESLTRLAEKYIAKGYRVRSGNLLESLRAFLRWDAPGDDKAGWYWGDQDEDIQASELIGQAVQAGLIREYDQDQPLRRLCLKAHRELNSDRTFGSGTARERLLIGTTCCEVEFGQEEHIQELASLNPAPTIARLRQDLAAAAQVDRLVIRPWDREGRA
jgi:hypothetical protein